jgi:putative peptidoglycan lipid II flippase
VQISPMSAEVPEGQVGQRILKATGAIFLFQVILKGFGIIEKMVVGRLFPIDGIDAYKADAYFAAQNVAFSLYQFVDQVIMHSFLPAFVATMKAKDEEDAWRVASTVLNILLLFMTTVAVLGIIFAPRILPLFMPDWFSGATVRNADLIPLTIQLLRLMLVAVIFLGTSSLTYCLLNSYKQFALPASADLALKATVLAFALAFAGGELGPRALAIGFVIGAAAKLAVHFWGLGRRLSHYRPVLALGHPGVRQFGWLALPLIVGTLCSLVRQFYDTRFTSSLPEGSFSALKLARTLCDTPVSFFSFAFGIALFPFLADIAAAGNRVRLREMLMTATRLMVVIFLPLTVTFILLQKPIIIAFFGAANLAAAAPLQVYALYMLIGALEIIVLQFFFAMRDTLVPTIAAISVIPLHIAMAYMGVYRWEYQAAGIALALLISKGTKVVALYVLIRQKFDSFEARRTLLLVGKVLVSLVPLAIILLVTNHFLQPHLIRETQNATKPSKIKIVLWLLPFVGAGIGGFGVYGLSLALMGTEEFNLLSTHVVGKLRRRKSSVGSR